MKYHDNWEKNFDKRENRMFKFAIAVWVVGFIGSLLMMGVGIWAIIEIVGWVTAK